MLLEDQHLNSKVYGLCLQMIELTAIILNDPQLREIITYGLIPLTRILVNYLMVTEEDLRNWRQDANQYISDDENEHDSSNIKVLTLQTFSQLIENFEEDAVKCLMAIVDGLLFNAQDKDLKNVFLGILKRVPLITQNAIKALNLEELFDFNLNAVFGSVPSLAWKRKETALLLLGKFSTDIVATYTKDKKGALSTLLDSLISLLGDADLHPVRRLRSLSAGQKPLDHRRSVARQLLRHRSAHLAVEGLQALVLLPLFEARADPIDGCAEHDAVGQQDSPRQGRPQGRLG